MEEIIFDKDYWNNRFINNDSPWDIGNVSTPLKNYFDNLTNKNIHILIPGAGNAWEAEYLYKNGFQNVFVLDISDKAVHNFKKRCPDFPAENIYCEDFFDHDGKYDLIIEQTFFCALLPSLRPNYVAKMFSLLVKGGKLAGLLFNDPDLKGNPPFGGTKDEYLPLFTKYFKILQFDTAPDSIKPRAGRELFFEVEK